MVRTAVRLMVFLALFGLVLAAPRARAVHAQTAVTATPTGPANLLQNPGFENGFYKQCCQPTPEYLPNTPIDEVQIAVGWFAWWLRPDEPISGSDPGLLPFPASCEGSQMISCIAWHRPEYREAAPYRERIHAGNNAQKYFTFASVHEAGMYQVVGGVRPGSVVQFSIYLQGWSTNTAGSLISEGQTGMNMRIGIDPTGGTNPYSPNIIWTAPNDVLDQWGRYEISATSQADTVSVWVYSRPEVPNLHNDIYVDTAELIVVSGTTSSRATPRPTSGTPRPTNTPGPSPTPTLTRTPTMTFTPSPTFTPTATRTPTVTPTPTGIITSTPLPNGEVRHIVRQTDTLRVLAFYYGTTVEEIQRLNGLTNNIISVGQDLLIEVVDTPAPTATTTFTPEPTVTTAAATDTPAPATPAPAEPGEICVVTYNDANRNATNDAEAPVPGVALALRQNGAELSRAITVNAAPGHCFTALAVGTYDVDVIAPDGAELTTASSATVAVNADQTTEVSFGLATVAAAAATDTPVTPAETTANPTPIIIIIGAVGVALVLAAIVGVVVLVLRRRK